MGRRGEETPVRGKPQEEAGFRSFVSQPGLGTRCLNQAPRAGAEARREAAGRGLEVGGTGRDHAPLGGFKGGRADPGWFLYPLEGFLRPVLASSARRVLPPPTRVSPRQPARRPASGPCHLHPCSWWCSHPSSYFCPIAGSSSSCCVLWPSLPWDLVSLGQVNHPP